LVVDDEPQVREAVKLLLELDGHHIETAENGQLGLNLVLDRDYDVVFTDFVMPMMQGDEFARKAKAIKPGLPIIMVTAHADSLSTSTLPAGVDHILSKPFILSDLRQAICKVRQGRNQPSTCCH
jgi:two-component system, OmpR family, response regulator MprA